MLKAVQCSGAEVERCFDVQPWKCGKPPQELWDAILLCTTNHRGQKDRMAKLDEALQHNMQELNDCLEW